MSRMPSLTPACPRCARPVAAAQPRCLYCGAELPAAVVERAEAARAGLESPAAAAVPSEAETPPPTARRLVVLDLDGVDGGALASALRLSPFEAQQRRRRGGPELHRILPAEAAEVEA